MLPRRISRASIMVPRKPPLDMDSLLQALRYMTVDHSTRVKDMASHLHILLQVQDTPQPRDILHPQDMELQPQDIHKWDKTAITT